MSVWTTDDHEPEVLPRESWLDRDDPRFGAIVDAADAPTSLSEWAAISAKLTEDALLTLFREMDHDYLKHNATVVCAYDHREKVRALVDKGHLERANTWCYEVTEQGREAEI